MENENLSEKISGKFSGYVGFHNSCHSYRELGIAEQPIKIMNQISGYKWTQPQGEPVCCGFGGLFSFKHHQIAETMAKTRLEMFTNVGTDTIVSNDPGCIMHMKQEAKALNINIRILHLTEFDKRLHLIAYAIKLRFLFPRHYRFLCSPMFVLELRTQLLWLG